ncbi:MAG: menaquinone biosynthesis decarboxylase [Bacteroidetes bacterium]|nr:menaquinone biosynthesis decarboxylase [Bacteroidota bacterium]
MAFSSLAAFIKVLEQNGELARVPASVSPNLEITEITDRVSKEGGKALLFENTGYEFPVLINSMGSEKRICLALGVNSLDEVSEAIMQLAGDMMQSRESFISKLSLLPKLAGIASWMPKRINGRGKCQEIIMESPDLGRLPVLNCWPYDGGPFITLPLVHTIHPETGLRNLGMYRMQVFLPDMTGMHWHLHKNSAAHYREYKRLGRKMPVAVALGGDPAYTYAATAPLPENIDEYLLAGFLRRKSVELVKCISCDLEVPSDADFIIEGYVDPDEELILEGPFGDHTGFYSLADYYPRFHVTCITHRKDAIYPTTIVGIPPQEDAWIGKATERIFLSPIRLSMVPEIENMVMPVEGVFHNIVLISVNKTYPGQALKVMNSLWGAGQMMFNKILVVLDGGIDLNDYDLVLSKISENVDPAKDIILTRGPVDVLDHSSSQFAIGSKLGIDATSKLASEPESIRTTRIVDKGKFKVILEKYGCEATLVSENIPALIIEIDKQEKGQVRDIHNKLIDGGLIDGIDWVIYIDQEASGLAKGDIAWLVANNIDPVRDCFFAKDGKGLDIGPMAVDGTMKSRKLDEFKRDWPNVITMSPAVIKEVDKRWDEFGLGKFISSPSLKYVKLVRTDGAIAG